MRNILTILLLATTVFAASARELHADFSVVNKAGNNATWNAATRTFTWTAGNDARIPFTDIVNASNGDLTLWKKLVLVTSGYTDSYRIDIVFTDNNVLQGTKAWGKFYSAGTKELVLSAGLTAAQLAMVKEIRVNTNSGSGSIVIEDLYLVNDEQAAAGTLTCAGFANLNGNCAYDAGTHTFSWNASSNNTAKMFVMEAGELAKYETLTFTIANLVSGPCRVVFMDANGNKLGEPQFYNAGSKTITIASKTSSKLTEDEIAQVTEIRFAGASSAGSVEIDPTSVKLNRAAETLSITTDANGYASFSSSYKLDLSNLPEGLTAYVASLSENVLTLSAKDVAVPGNTGLLFHGAVNTTYEVPVAASAEAVEGNALLANVNINTLMSDAGVYYFAMVKDAAGLTFAKIAEDPGMEIPANKAYVAVPAAAFAAGAPLLRVAFGENEATALELTDENEGKIGIYDLLGRRLSQPVKGINIINGKKVFIK